MQSLSIKQETEYVAYTDIKSKFWVDIKHELPYKLRNINAIMIRQMWINFDSLIILVLLQAKMCYQNKEMASNYKRVWTYAKIRLLAT